jgi:hypothetical protein
MWSLLARVLPVAELLLIESRNYAASVEKASVSVHDAVEVQLVVL